MKTLTLLFSLILATTIASAADTKTQSNRLLHGIRASTADKVFEIDTNDGASNPKIKIANSDKNWHLMTNKLKMGDGLSSSKTLEADLGLGASNPKLKYDQGTSKWQFANDGTTFSDLGTGGGGSSTTNYATNPGAETDASTCVAYADAAAAVPVDGVGGSPVVTCTRTTSSPLQGTGSFLITKDAADRQGSGVAVDFTIDAGYQGQRIAVGAAFSTAGTYTAGIASDVRMFVYDVTNAALLPTETNVDVSVITGSSGRFNTSFVAASNSTSYRFILHIATTNASAWTFKFDDVKLSPNYFQITSPWASCSAVSIGAVTTPPTKGTVQYDECRYKREGSTLVWDYRYRHTTAGAIGSGDYLYSLPTVDSYALNINYNRFHATTVSSTQESVCGMAFMQVNGGAGNLIAPFLFNATQVKIAQWGSASSTLFVGSGHLSLDQNNYWMNFTTCQIPIVGWSDVAPL